MSELRVDRIAVSTDPSITINSPLSFESAPAKMRMPTWTNATRPTTSLSTGQIGFNTSTNAAEFYDGSSWRSTGAVFTRLTTPGYWQTSFTSSPSGTLNATTTFGVPSSAKALLVSGYYHITGYSTSGHSDHVSCIFGGYPSSSGNSNWSFTAATSDIWQEFVLYHDGDSSGSPHYYGYWTDGGVISTDNNTIYYQLGKGRSGGTHYVHLWCFGYWS